jgi:hypothetical protein
MGNPDNRRLILEIRRESESRTTGFRIMSAALLCALTVAVSAQSPTNGVPATVPADDPVAWEFSAAVMAYFVPDSREYVQPTFTADHGWLHLEARYNYEDLETGSAWVGYNFGGGDPLAWSLTPMLGGVFGDTTGIAPGYKGSLSWWKLELYSEGQYVIDAGDSSDSFFYNWSELTVAPWDWVRLGLVTQRTRLYESDREIQRGLLLGFSYRRLTLTGYLLDPDESRPTFIVGLGAEF